MIFICSCNNIEHQLIFLKEDNEVFMTVHLIPERNIFKRIKSAIKYIFGYKCKYGHFDEFIFKKEDSDKLQSIVDHLRCSSY